MTIIDPVSTACVPLSERLPIIDTHTHFDAPVFDNDRILQAQQAFRCGVEHIVLVGYLHRHFARLYDTKTHLDGYAVDKTDKNNVPKTHIALGLHPFYIEQHTEAHLSQLALLVEQQRPLAIGEIGLDTFTQTMKQPNIFKKQQHFFNAQLDLAVQHQLPVMLHIRKAHAEALALLKAHDYQAHQLGGIAHSFSGGEQEAKAFVKLGFKLGVTGQITNPNAKKLRRAIQAAVATFGVKCLVIETDCPDMMPIMGQRHSTQPSALGQAGWGQTEKSRNPPLSQNITQRLNQNYDSNIVDQNATDNQWQGLSMCSRNVPANLPWVLLSLSELLNVSLTELAAQLWQNSCEALQVSWTNADAS